MPSVLITGTSSGIGLVSAVEMARRGWTVIASMRDPGRGERLREAAARAGVADRVAIEALDVTDAAALPDALARVLARAGGRLDAVVHNAGIATAGAFEDLPEAELRRVMETNFFAVLALTRALLPTFRAQRRGRIVVVSSNSAFAGEPANSIYVASKWAIEGWAESLAYEVERFGIELVLIEPGPYRTEIWQSSPRILPEGSAYTPWLRQLEVAIDTKVMASARDPREVATAIATALEAVKPRFRYPVSPQAWIGHLMRGVVPTRAQRWLVTRFLGLKAG
ncbi:MAG TPA: SDR family oxidoreductase [Candidatus Dormibacteraeota bacterium]|nr:SDR family oxidoreductase [Candidatus Dormibacteraeota bacterium]